MMTTVCHCEAVSAARCYQADVLASVYTLSSVQQIQQQACAVVFVSRVLLHCTVALCQFVFLTK